MLFNSYEFIFVFLPITLLVYFLVGRARDQRLALGWLLLASLFFYAWWKPANLWIILFSVCFNYGVARYCIHGANPLRRKWFLIFGIAANLGLLGYFKYANFFVDNWNELGGPILHFPRIILPIAISFFTFQQIVFLVEAYRGEAGDYDFLHYALLVTFYPHLIAGPIVHYREMLTQFTRPNVTRFRPSHFSVGVTIFCIGLFKKVVMADGVAPFANSIFDAAAGGASLTPHEAWTGALAYTFQLYFDFSGYSDMAIGLARMIGIRFPMNFNSPYKSINIIDFWRRWHITLSRFLRDYLYIPLGGNRKGRIRRYTNLFITMLLGGLWHGAGWTFVIWGGLHGLYLVINNVWQALRERLGFTRTTLLGRGVARVLTFGCAVLAWVFFRAQGFAAARTMLSAMFGGNSAAIATGPVAAHPALQRLGPLERMFPHDLIDPYAAIGWIAALWLIAWFAPNTQQIMARYRPVLEHRAIDAMAFRNRWLLWRPSYAWSAVMALLSAAALVTLWIGSNADFIYFQF
jgi:alginate O-acetyltransferase complex protein AlgI